MNDFKTKNKKRDKDQYMNIGNLVDRMNMDKSEKKGDIDYDKLIMIDKLKRISKFLILGFIIIILIYRYFFYIDIRNKCFITIKSLAIVEPNSQKIKKAITVLRHDFPDVYSDLCSNVNTIETYYFDSHGGLYFRDPSKVAQKKKRIIYINPSSEFNWQVSIIAHEVCHAVREKEGKPAEEKECYAAGAKVYEKITGQKFPLQY